MEGPFFRVLDPHECLEVVPRLQVLAWSSPGDKKILVETLHSQGDIVGITGGGANGGPAPKTANVGFSVSITGTEVAMEASDIILIDDSFTSIVKAAMWGCCVDDAVHKFLQFRISTNIAAVTIMFVPTVASTKEESVLSAIQLLWMNIVVGTFATLALATDPALESLLDRKPDTHETRLFTADMIKATLGQSVYQVLILVSTSLVTLSSALITQTRATRLLRRLWYSTHLSSPRSSTRSTAGGSTTNCHHPPGSMLDMSTPLPMSAIAGGRGSPSKTGSLCKKHDP